MKGAGLAVALYINSSSSLKNVSKTEKQTNKHKFICAGRGRGLLFLRSGRSEFTHPASFLQHFQNEASVPLRRRSRRR